MTNIKPPDDLSQLVPAPLTILLCMVFSKSFGYAIRGILYVAAMSGQERKVSLDEIAEKLKVPRHFLAKVMKRVVKDGILDSRRGPTGGFLINEKTLQTPLARLVEITGEKEKFNSCVLRFRTCSGNPCPLHDQVELMRNQWQELLTNTRIANLVKKDEADWMLSLEAIHEITN